MREIYIIPIIFGLQVVVHIHDMVGIYRKKKTPQPNKQNHLATSFIYLSRFEKSEIFFPLFNTNFLEFQELTKKVSVPEFNKTNNKHIRYHLRHSKLWQRNRKNTRKERKGNTKQQ